MFTSRTSPLAVATTSLAALFCSTALATPSDWCVRPEASEYKEADIKPGTRVKTVRFPNGVGYTKKPVTFTFTNDGLLESVRNEDSLTQDCTTSYQRDRRGRVVQAATQCQDGPKLFEKSYSYDNAGMGWVEQTSEGTVIFNVTTRFTSDPKWSMTYKNKDRAGPDAPGATAWYSYDDECRMVGPQHYTEMLLTPTGVVRNGPIRTNTHRIERVSSGSRVTITMDSELAKVADYATDGLVIREKFLVSGSEVSHDYVLDQHGNWIERRSQSIDIISQQPKELEITKRQLTYY